MQTPTCYPEINFLIYELLKRVQAILGSQLAGFYLEGSLASDAFDQDSDIDFVVVAEDEIDEEQFLALQRMHDELARLDTPWAIQLEGFYLSRPVVRRHTPHARPVPNLERGQGERLKWLRLGQDWDIHRSILWERGITLAGPLPQTLVDPVSPDQVRQAARSVLFEWIASLLDHSEILQSRGYQSYIVLSLCRILYTLQTGSVASKKAAANWAQSTLPGRWYPLIASTWEGRHNPDAPASPDEIRETHEFIRYTLEKVGRESNST